jgi:hypothetical protein
MKKIQIIKKLALKQNNVFISRMNVEESLVEKLQRQSRENL